MASIKDRGHCEPAKSLFDRCGGVAAIVEATGLNRSNVYRCLYPKGRNGGTGGWLPRQTQEAMLAAARAGKLPHIDPTRDFYLPETAADAAA